MHDETELDENYHSLQNAVGIMTGFVALAIRELEAEGRGQSEIALILQKALQQQPKIKTLIYGDYLLRKREEILQKAEA